MKYCAKLIVLGCLLGVLVPAFAAPSGNESEIKSKTESNCTEANPCITGVVVSKIRYYKKVNNTFEELGLIKKNKIKKQLKKTLRVLDIDSSTGITMLKINLDNIAHKNPVYVGPNAFKLSHEPKINCSQLGVLTASIQGSDIDQTSGVSTGHASNPNDYCKGQ